MLLSSPIGTFKYCYCVTSVFFTHLFALTIQSQMYTENQHPADSPQLIQPFSVFQLIIEVLWLASSVLVHSLHSHLPCCQKIQTAVIS